MRSSGRTLAGRRSDPFPPSSFSYSPAWCVEFKMRLSIVSFQLGPANSRRTNWERFKVDLRGKLLFPFFILRIFFIVTKLFVEKVRTFFTEVRIMYERKFWFYRVYYNYYDSSRVNFARLPSPKLCKICLDSLFSRWKNFRSITFLVIKIME